MDTKKFLFTVIKVYILLPRPISSQPLNSHVCTAREDYPAYPPAHPKFDGLVFVDKHTQPSENPCMGDLMSEYYGNITPEIAIRNIVGPFQTGDLHAALYDYGTRYCPRDPDTIAHY